MQRLASVSHVMDQDASRAQKLVLVTAFREALHELKELPYTKWQCSPMLVLVELLFSNRFRPLPEKALLILVVRLPHLGAKVLVQVAEIEFQKGHELLILQIDVRKVIGVFVWATRSATGFAVLLAVVTVNHVNVDVVFPDVVRHIGKRNEVRRIDKVVSIGVLRDHLGIVSYNRISIQGQQMVVILDDGLQ